jgi:hypothetical protein
LLSAESDASASTVGRVPGPMPVVPQWNSATSPRGQAFKRSKLQVASVFVSGRFLLKPSSSKRVYFILTVSSPGHQQKGDSDVLTREKMLYSFLERDDGVVSSFIISEYYCRKDHLCCSSRNTSAGHSEWHTTKGYTCFQSSGTSDYTCTRRVFSIPAPVYRDRLFSVS